MWLHYVAVGRGWTISSPQSEEDTAQQVNNGRVGWTNCLAGDIKTHHNCKVQHEEEGEATSVAQEACEGERQIW